MFNQGTTIMPDNSIHSTFIDTWLKQLLHPGCPDEYESKQLLSHFGIHIPGSQRLDPREEPGTVSLAPPFAIKVCSPDILHKTEEKGVLLNISGDGLGQAIDEMRQRFPGKPLLVEEQVSFQGPEFIVGALVDPDYGIAVMAGAGGIMTELYKDAGFRLAPCTKEDARSLLDELTIAPVLNGFRGLGLDKGLLAEIVSTAGKAAIELGPCFSQLDINPVVFSGNHWVALDAQIILTAEASNPQQTD